jgi:hypothetical protein
MNEDTDKRIYHIAKQLIEVCCDYAINYDGKALSFPIMTPQQHIEAIVREVVVPELCKLGAVKCTIVSDIMKVANNAADQVLLCPACSNKTYSQETAYKMTLSYFTGYLEEVIKSNMEL